MFTSFLNPVSFRASQLISSHCYLATMLSSRLLLSLIWNVSVFHCAQDINKTRFVKTTRFKNNRTQRNRNANNLVSFCDHSNIELTAEIKDAPRGADSCHSGSGSSRRNRTEVSVASSRSVPGHRLVLAVPGRRKNATGPEIIPSCGRSGAWLRRWTNGDFIYRALLGGWPA